MNAVTALRAAVICAAAIALRSATMSSPPAPGGISPALPSPWMPALGRVGSWDLALPRYADAWLRHPILGDPSYDSFTRAAGNHLVRGAPPYAWPVNVSVLHDPLSGNWYAYVGVYPEGYAIGGGAPPSYCHIYRSRDRGQTWEDVGPAFRDPSFRFEGDSETAATASAFGPPPQFTARQAAAGKKLYLTRCAVCHGTTLTNGAYGTALAGDYFKQKWSGKTVLAFFEKSKTMPPSKPASLSDAAYADLVAYILEANGSKPGAAALPAGGEPLARMTIR